MTDEAPVLIAGGGLVGLSAAAFLAQQGIRSLGRGAFSNSLTIYFTADLSPYIGDKAWSLIYVNNSTLHGFFRLNRAATAGFLGVNIVGNPAADPEAAVAVVW